MYRQFQAPKTKANEETALTVEQRAQLEERITQLEGRITQCTAMCQREIERIVMKTSIEVTKLLKTCKLNVKELIGTDEERFVAEQALYAEYDVSRAALQDEGDIAKEQVTARFTTELQQLYPALTAARQQIADDDYRQRMNYRP